MSSIAMSYASALTKTTPQKTLNVDDGFTSDDIGKFEFNSDKSWYDICIEEEAKNGIRENECDDISSDDESSVDVVIDLEDPTIDTTPFKHIFPYEKKKPKPEYMKLYRTKFCRSLYSNQECYGKKCCFAHSAKELRVKKCEDGSGCKKVVRHGFNGVKFVNIGPHRCVCMHPGEGKIEYLERTGFIKYCPKAYCEDLEDNHDTQKKKQENNEDVVDTVAKCIEEMKISMYDCPPSVNTDEFDDTVSVDMDISTPSPPSMSPQESPNIPPLLVLEKAHSSPSTSSVKSLNFSECSYSNTPPPPPPPSPSFYHPYYYTNEYHATYYPCTQQYYTQMYFPPVIPPSCNQYPYQFCYQQ